MTAVTYLEGRPRDHRGEQECILIISTAVTSSHASLPTSLLISSSLIPSLSLPLSLFVHTPALYLGYLAYSSIRPPVCLCGRHAMSQMGVYCTLPDRELFRDVSCVHTAPESSILKRHVYRLRTGTEAIHRAESCLQLVIVICNKRRV